MDLYAKGQLSYLILNCLLERDFYGLDIISGISERSNGKINLKKPSVYSNLTRMEKQGFVSAYLKSSDLGPNRKYYSVTEKGRNFYKELNEYFERNNIDVFRDFADNEVQESPVDVKDENIYQSEEVPDNNIVEKEESTSKGNISEETSENDYFDFSSLDENAQSVGDDFDNKQALNEDDYFAEDQSTHINNNDITKEAETAQEIPTTENDKISVNKVDELSDQAATEENVVESNESVVDDSVFSNQENSENYNQRIYDISKDINRYKKKKSFAEDQISITVNAPLSASQERTNQNVQAFRNSFDEERSKNDTDKISQYDFSKQMEYRFNKEENVEEQDKKDDAKYITDRIEFAQSARKITPPRLKIVENVSQKENRLPPPKRDTSIDPSHKEILSRLYSKTKDNSSDIVREDAIYDYTDLKDYYDSQNITFTEYKKPVQKYTHNTNKLYLILSIVVFTLASVLSALIYITLRFTSQLNPTTNFLFLVLPAVLILDVVLKAYNYKIYSSWFPKQMLAPWKIWIITIFLIGATVGLNAIWGFGSASFADYSTTLLLPILLILIIVPVRYYIKRFMLVKYWR